MLSEPIDFPATLKARRESAAESIREISTDEMHELTAKLFPDTSHPWFELINKFLEEHKTERGLQGETSDGYGFVYYPDVNRGIWYQFQDKVRGVGRLSDQSLATLKEITAV